MKLWMHKVEKAVDILIPPMLVVLMALIVIELFFEELAHEHEIWIILLDYIVIIVFVLDVTFKYIRIKPFKSFLSKCWIDIIAVFPFALLFRLFEGFFEIFAASEIIKEGQSIFHEAVEIEKEAGKIEKEAGVIIKEVEKAGKVARTTRFSRMIRPIARAPRLVKAFVFHERPTGGHHPHDKEFSAGSGRRKRHSKQ